MNVAASVVRNDVCHRLAIFALYVSLMIATFACVVRAQSSAVESSADAPTQSLRTMETAGVKLVFDVVSVKPNRSGGPEHANISFVPGAPFPRTGGLFSATDFSLITYIAWAYDIPGDQVPRVMAQLPRWAVTDPSDRFDIEARAQGNPTKAQMQLMVQSLLSNRFNLAIHTEAKESPVYALALARPGKTGPQLRMHVNDGMCPAATSAAGAPLPPADPSQAFPPPCSIGVVAMRPTAPGRVRIGGRNVTMDMIAGIFPFLSKAGVMVDRPVFDGTGLTGTFDFAIEFAPQIEGPLPAGTDTKPDATGPTFLDALQDQLGLKLESRTGPVDIFIVDHIEEPGPN